MASKILIKIKLQMDSVNIFIEMGPKLASLSLLISKNFQRFVFTPENVFEKSILQDKELEEIFQSLKPKTSPPGFDNFSTLVVKIISENIFIPVKYIYIIFHFSKE